jgi:hypothetical protein
LELDFDSFAITKKLLAAGFGAHLHGRERLQNAIVQLPGNSEPFLFHNFRDLGV